MHYHIVPFVKNSEEALARRGLFLALRAWACVSLRGLPVPQPGHRWSWFILACENTLTLDLETAATVHCSRICTNTLYMLLSVEYFVLVLLTARPVYVFMRLSWICEYASHKINAYIYRVHLCIFMSLCFASNWLDLRCQWGLASC